MMYRNILSFTFAAIILASGLFSVSAQTVSVTLADGRVSRGSTVKGTVVLTIPEGLHVNSNKPNSEFAIPTSVRISGEGIKVGTIDYPQGANRKFQFSESELNVYEGEISIPFSINVLKRFKGRILAIKTVVRYQACTEEVCYPPKNKEVMVTAQVK